MPRDRLARLIRYAADGGAAVIVVDVALDRPSTDLAADKALAVLIEAYPADAPDLVLLRTARPSPPWQSQPVQWRQPYFYAAKLSPAVHFAHSRYVKDNSDLRLRRWRLVEWGCLAGEPEPVPSVQLLVDVLLRDGRAGWQGVQAQLAAEGPRDCAALRRHQGAGELLHYGQRSVRVGGQGVDQRVVYSFSDARRGDSSVNRLSAEPLLRQLDTASADPVSGRLDLVPLRCLGGPCRAYPGHAVAPSLCQLHGEKGAFA